MTPQYLTPAAQREVARLAARPTCREALLATQPSFEAITSEGALHALTGAAGAVRLASGAAAVLHRRTVGYSGWRMTGCLAAAASSRRRTGVV
jgi:hypothetical protein